MENLAADSLARLSADDLRGVLARLFEELGAVRAKVSGLEEQVATLQKENTGLREQVATLTAENRTLKDEVARLKDLPRRPPDKPSGMERSTEAKLGPKKKQRSRRRRGPTLPRITITEEVVLPAQAPRDRGSKVMMTSSYKTWICVRGPRGIAVNAGRRRRERR